MLETLDHIYSAKPHKVMIHDESIREMPNLHPDLITSSLSVIICANEQLERQIKGYSTVNFPAASNDLLAACKDKHKNLRYLHNTEANAADINSSEIATNSDDNTLALYLGGSGNINNQLDTHTRHVIIANGRRKADKRKYGAKCLFPLPFSLSFLPFLSTTISLYLAFLTLLKSLFLSLYLYMKGKQQVK